MSIPDLSGLSHFQPLPRTRMRTRFFTAADEGIQSQLSHDFTIYA